MRSGIQEQGEDAGANRSQPSINSTGPLKHLLCAGVKDSGEMEFPKPRGTEEPTQRCQWLISRVLTFVLFGAHTLQCLCANPDSGLRDHSW